MSLTVPVMQPQNFSIPAGYNEVITFTIDPAVTPSLEGMTIWWRVYEEQFGIPVAGTILEKTAPDITSIDSPLGFMVQMFTADTLNLLRNYYHEATILDANNEMIGGSYGIMTITATLNRESGQ